MSVDSRDTTRERGEAESLAGASESRRVLVTGASGFLGRAVVRRLVERGWRVDAVSSSARETAGPVAESVTWHLTNLLDPDAVARLLGSLEPTRLLHLAWAPNRGIYSSPENLRWLAAGAQLFAQFFENGGRRAVAAGSSAEYDWRAGVCRERTTPLAGGGLYGASKRALAEVLEELCPNRGSGEGEGISGAWARIFFLFGPHEPEQRLVASVVRGLLEGKPVQCSQGSQVRDYLYVEDAADALVRLLESELAGPINVASGEGVRVRDLVRDLAVRIAGDEGFGLIDWGDEDPDPFVVADSGRLQDELGWRPPVGRAEGLERTIAWWRRRMEDDVSGAGDD